MWRCAQPLSGLINRVEDGDVKMLTEISILGNGVSGITVFDARPRASASANRVRGGGFEDERYYENMNLMFCGIHNIHAVRNSHNAMQFMFSFPELFHDMNLYGPEVDSTGYMQLVADILKGVNMVVEAILYKKRNVLIRCSDGWDRTS